MKIHTWWLKNLCCCVQIDLDGPFGAPASNIFRASHAVLIATGIGVTPFSSILQSIMYRYLASRQQCPSCGHKYHNEGGGGGRGGGGRMFSLRKVDFFWINRDQKSFEWFVSLLDNVEKELTKDGCADDRGRFLSFHLYITGALQSSDMRAVGLRVAMDIVHKKAKGQKSFFWYTVRGILISFFPSRRKSETC